MTMNLALVERWESQNGNFTSLYIKILLDTAATFGILVTATSATTTAMNRFLINMKGLRQAATPRLLRKKRYTC